MARILAFAVLVALVFLSAGTAQAAEQGAVDDVSKEIMCQCGCTMIVYNCDCGTADQMRGVIREKLDGGQTKQDIMNYFVDQYGETTLAAPTKEGFNITAWITPFVVLVLGIGVVYLVLSRWILASSKEPALTEIKSEEELSEYEERFRLELERFEGRS